MANLVITFKNPGTYNFVAGATTTDVRLIGAGGAGGAGGTLGGGGGGGGGGFARTPDVSTVVGQTYSVVVGAGGIADGGDGVPSTFNGTQVVADSGKGGTDGSAISAGDPGAGGTNNTGTTTIDGSAGSGTTGGTAAQTGIYPNGGTAETAPGGGGNGGALLGVSGTNGAVGIAVLAYTTGTGQTTSTAVSSRHLTLYRLFTSVITSTAVFSRLLTIVRGYAVSTELTATSYKTVGFIFSSTTSLTSGHVRKVISLLRNVSTTLTSVTSKAIIVATKTATTTLVGNFQRLVTLRRKLIAVTGRIATLWLRLKARLIPKSDITVIETFKQIFMEWE